MDTRGLVIIWGFLFLTITSLVLGKYVFPNTWYGALLLIIGIVGVVAWVIGIFMLANAMNSDI